MARRPQGHRVLVLVQVLVRVLVQVLALVRVLRPAQQGRWLQSCSICEWSLLI